MPNTPQTGRARSGHAIRIPLDAAPTRNQAQKATGWSSINWSGYAVSNNNPGHYHSVSATWIVPSVQVATDSQSLPWWRRVLNWLFPPLTPASSGDSYSATWIGIDGFENSELIQTGTAQNVVSGAPEYYAWWEILPAPENEIDPVLYPVSPGDRINASIVQQPDASWQITMENQSSGWTAVLSNLSYTGPQTSVEWIEEAPQIGGSVAPLANYRTVTFQNCAANEANLQLDPSQAGVLVQNGQPTSVPSTPGPAGNDFVVQYGSTKPGPPVS